MCSSSPLHSGKNTLQLGINSAQAETCGSLVLQRLPKYNSGLIFAVSQRKSANLGSGCPWPYLKPILLSLKVKLILDLHSYNETL